jgi:tetratricopeptide (TPR) repeat protein
MLLISALRYPLVLGFVAILFVAGCDSPEERAEKHYTRGLALIEAEDPEKARLEFRNALQLNPQLMDARYQLGLMAEASENISGAIGHFREVADSDPDNLDVRVKLTRFMLLGNALEDARRYADQAMALAPEDPDVLAGKAAVELRLGNAALARQTARQALARDPELVAAHLVLISDKTINGDLQGALHDVDAVLAFAPDDQSVNLLRLRLIGEIGEPAEVEAQLRRMIELNPEELAFREALGRHYLQQEDMAGLEAVLRELVDRDDRNFERVATLVRFIIATEDTAAARQELQRRIEAAPGPRIKGELELLLARFEYSSDQPAAARAILAAMIEEREGPLGAEARLQLARIEMDQDNGDAARTLLDQVLETDEDNVEALAMRSSLLIDAYETDAAIIDLRRALNLDPQNPQLMLLEARAHERNGNVDLVRDRLASAARLSGYQPDVTMGLVRFLLSQGETSAARATLTEAVQQNGDSRDMLTALAELQLRAGDTAAANETAARLRALGDTEGTADQILAATLAQEGRIDESTAVLEDTVADDGGAGMALASLVSTYVRSGETERAEALLDDLIAENPANIRAMLLRAELHLLDNDPASARSLLEQIVREAPEDMTGHLVLARFEVQQGDSDAAEMVLRDALAIEPQAPAVRLMLAGMLEARGAFDEAIAEYRVLYDSNPDTPIVFNNLASLLAEFHENDPEAMALANRVSRRLSNSQVPHFQDTYGWVQFLNGNYDEAVSALRVAAEALPNNPLVRYHLGRAYAATGETALAREELEAALSIQPDFPKAQSARQALDEIAAGGGG